MMHLYFIFAVISAVLAAVFPNPSLRRVRDNSAAYNHAQNSQAGVEAVVGCPWNNTRRIDHLYREVAYNIMKNHTDEGRNSFVAPGSLVYRAWETTFWYICNYEPYRRIILTQDIEIASRKITDTCGNFTAGWAWHDYINVIIGVDFIGFGNCEDLYQYGL
ncbi:hypothetical protein QBC34DRAFT_385698 [Podospora aff. communis PSN243]|uniref:Uncharacterized protein n=1 Tax=Podospora aff. communis PSN243 TaxID=3040156 RepID=A0AAV9G9G5_9PEZI|nr:hypothetical protein QBC34DRAFT_385698 [Podospora aff. communis PSN243]